MISISEFKVLYGGLNFEFERFENLRGGGIRVYFISGIDGDLVRVWFQKDSLEVGDLYNWGYRYYRLGDICFVGGEYLSKGDLVYRLDLV